MSWPKKGYQCQEGNWRRRPAEPGLERMHTLPRTLLCTEAASGECQPALPSVPSFLQGTCKENLTPYGPLLEFQPSISQPQASLGLPTLPCGVT